MSSLPLLHGTIQGPWWAAWQFRPSMTLLLLVAAGGYGLARRQIRLRGATPPPTWQPIAFYAGLLSAALALIGPLDTFNDNLFVMHMTQHLVLMQVSAPLLLLGRPVQLIIRALPAQQSRSLLRATLRPRAIRQLLSLLSGALVISILMNGNLIFWHLPGLYEAALRNDLVHEIMHVCFFGIALIFWWPIIDPVPRHHRLHPLKSALVLFLAMAVGSAVGALITFADSVIYPFYQSATMPWGLTPQYDQQLAGLVMWVVSGLYYMAVMFVLVIRFLQADEQRAAAASAGE